MKCDSRGNFIPQDSPPPPPPVSPQGWFPYESQTHFELTDFLFRQNEMPQSQVTRLMELWAMHTRSDGLKGHPPYLNNQHLLDTIDATLDGNVKWKSFSVKYCGVIPEDPPSWMCQEYEVWCRDAKEVIKTMLQNEEFDGEFDYVPYKDFDEKGRRCYKDFMSGDWAWLKAVRLS